jgi:hypothetical protein
MKKLLVVLLSLGLIVAFAATASAQPTVKFGGSYYVVGVYDNNAELLDSAVRHSRAYFFQRLRLQPEFKIAEGLTLTARIDALEKQWGNSNWRRGVAAGDDSTSSRAQTATNAQRIQENIEFERSYVTFMTGIGQFQVGYQSTTSWGTVFGDSEGTNGARILYGTKLGPVQLLAIYEKVYEADHQTQVVANQGKVDADNDNYALAAIYNAKGIEGGLLYRHFVYKAGFGAATGRNGNGASVFNMVSPYMKATFGPVFVEAELSYWFGKLRKLEDGNALSRDVDMDSWSAYLHAKANIGPAYVGGLYGFASGDDGADAAKFKTNPTGGGTSWSPALMLMNDDYNTWAGNPYNAAYAGNSRNSGKTNMVLYKVYGGFNPTPKLNVEAGLIYATVDKVAIANTLQKKDLGTEFDVTATYKLYDNLSYMVGAAYLWTGDWWKANNPAALVGNDYMLMNRLSLSF